MSRDITTEDLLKVKRMGPEKAERILRVIKETPNATALTAEDFARYQGVSQGMGAELVKLVKDPDGYEPQAPTPRKKATAKKATAKKATPLADHRVPRPKKATAKQAKKATRKRTAKKAATNGRGKVKAGEIRQFARDAERLGLTDVATDLRNRVSSLLDEETVAKSELVNS